MELTEKKILSLFVVLTYSIHFTANQMSRVEKKTLFLSNFTSLQEKKKKTKDVTICSNSQLFSEKRYLYRSSLKISP